MFTLIFRALIIYIIILIVLRLMGKRQIAEMQPFELVITLIMADLACIPMTETTIPMLHGIVPLLTLATVHYLMSFLSIKSIRIRKFLNCKPIIVIDPNGIRYDALKSLNMNLNDLHEALRSANHFSLDEIAYAIVETNGNISILAKSQLSPPTAQDLKVKTNPASLSIILINDGKLIKENLLYLKLEKSFVDDILNKEKIKLKDVLILTINKQGSAYLQQKGKPCKTIQTNFKEKMS